MAIKEKQYKQICREILSNIGNEENIHSATHCATRLRITVKDVSKINMENIQDIELVKGAVLSGDQLQIIFGAGLVNEIYKVFCTLTGISNETVSDEKTNSDQNPIQKVIKSISDVFVEIIPAILAAAILMGLTNVLAKWDIVTTNSFLYAINRLASLASTAIFVILPMVVCYSATKRYGGRPILGLVVGAIMIDSSLANAYSVGSVGFNPEILNLFGLQIEMVGFQGGIIVALLMGFVVATLDKYFEKVIPDVVKLLFSPMLTVFISTILLFVIVGPFGRGLSNVITGGLLWMTENLGFIGYAIFAGLQQILVITGLHHILNAIEATLIADTGRNILNPLMSVALIAQGGAVLGYLALNFNNKRTKEVAIPSFISILFGISEPAIFGINLRYKFPLIAGCIAAAITGAYVYFTDLSALGFGATAIPGFAIVNPVNNGYVNYIIAHLIGLISGFAFTIIIGKFMGKKENTAKKEVVTFLDDSTETAIDEIKLSSIMEGEVLDVSNSSDPVFAGETMGKGVVIKPTSGKVYAPADGTIEFIFPSKHALGFSLKDGSKLLIHCGINTVNMNGNGFEVFVNEGQKVKKGDMLLEFDLNKVIDSGYSTETMLLVAEVADKKTVSVPLEKDNIITIK